MNLMRGALITTPDNLAEGMTTVVHEAPMSLRALLQQQMETAIPSSRRTFVAAV